MAHHAPSSPLNATVINISPAPHSSPQDESPQDTNDTTSRRRKQQLRAAHNVQGHRNLIRHIFQKIIKRKRPQSALLRLGEQCRSISLPDQFENEDTIDLLLQLRSVLMLCRDNGSAPQILMRGDRTPSNSPVSSRSNSPARPASPSHSHGATASIHTANGKKDTRSIFETILWMLDDLVVNDSRYKTVNPKPSRPPYMMQSVLVDIALVLIQCCDDTSGLCTIGFTMLSAFDTFNDGNMLGKLLSMFIDTLLPKLMTCKDEQQREDRFPVRRPQNQKKKHSSSTARHDPPVANATPTINIHSPDSDSTSRSSPLTIDTRLCQIEPPSLLRTTEDEHSPLQSQFSRSSSTQGTEQYQQAYALFTPLFYFMIQYLDPYLASYRNDVQENLSFTIPRHASSISNFHRALRFMIHAKPDMYLDILDVIARSTSEVKFRACQILFHYYGVSLGHVVVAEPLPKLGFLQEFEYLERKQHQQQLEEERQRQQQAQQQPQQPSNDPHFLATVIGSNASFHVPNINKRYRQALPERPPISQRPSTTTSDSTESETAEILHTWYPHMFSATTDNHADDLADQARFSTNPLSLSVITHDNMTVAYCRECYKVIKGYGLRCYQCKCTVHYKCFNQQLANHDLDIMFYVKEGGIQKVVSPQFCHIPVQPRSTISPSATTPELLFEMEYLGHHFHLVNIYTLMICACCHRPLWGISQQGYRCSECNRFVHSSCLSQAMRQTTATMNIHECQPRQPLLERDTLISQRELNNTLLAFYGTVLPTTPQDVKDKSFEEISTMLNILLLQENIMHCGIAAGCLLVSYGGDDPLMANNGHADEPSERVSMQSMDICPRLTSAITMCRNQLSSADCKTSMHFNEFYINRKHNLNDFMFAREEYLGHVAAIMKSAVPNSAAHVGSTTHPTPAAAKRRSAGDSRGFLQVMPASSGAERWNDRGLDEGYDEDSVTECIPVTHMESWISDNLHIKSRLTTQMLLQHMHNLGFLERVNGLATLYTFDTEGTSTTTPSDANPHLCIFPVPYAIDISANVNLLVDTIESCLDDLDLTINECGLLLLTRRCWPDPFMSSYTIERLLYAVLSWLFQEDEKLLALHAEYTASKQKLPGIKRNRWSQSAQAMLASRMKDGTGADRGRQSVQFNGTVGMSSGLGNLYVTSRAALRERYINRWMMIIHDTDSALFTTMIYDVIERIVEERDEESVLTGWQEPQDKKRATLQHAEKFVECVYKLKSYGLTFSSLEPIMTRWFDKTYSAFDEHDILREKEPADLRHLAKLCSPRLASIQKTPAYRSSIGDTNPSIDIVIALFAKPERESTERGIRWLTLLMHSGTGVPSNALAKIARLLVSNRVSIRTTAEFLKLLWYQAVNVLNVPTPRVVIIDIISYLNETALESFKSKNEAHELTLERLWSAQLFIKYSAALTCYAFNCPLSNITELDLVPYFGDHIARLSHSKRASMNRDSTPIRVDESTPIIRCMLLYLQYDQLNVHVDVIKMFYGLVNWSYGISNKSDVINKCVPALIPALWELLVPAYDSLSDITLNLLMKLINIDVQYFHACVYQIFEDSNWEVRYHGLDNLYGLFTKMDVAFQQKWFPFLSHLGPVFSYFVSCLWDKEEYVRSKAVAYIRTFGTLHIRSALRCWEAYFLEATDRQRISLVNLMIRFNAMFPEWQVLQWESLLQALKPSDHDGFDAQSMDILEQYMRPDEGALDAAGEDVVSDKQALHGVETENVRVLMLTLAFQMLSNHLPMDMVQMSHFKFILVQQMGFSNCQYFETGRVVTFGHLTYDPDDPAQVAIMLACSHGLKKVVDSFAPLPAEAVVTMMSERTPQSQQKLTENTSPGVHFIDVILKFFHPSVDLTKLGHLMLRTWLEIVLIVIYKHDILDRNYEDSIVGCMKQVIELLTKNISEENKLLVLEISKCLLRRSDHLAPMVLSKQITALSKVMIKLQTRTHEPLFLKAKQFLKSAFLEFAVAGLFVLMFKDDNSNEANRRELELFFVLRNVIDPDDIVPEGDMHEVIYLRDQPVRDVLENLMKQQMDRKAFSNVLYNTNRYIETLHSHPYPEVVLNDYASFLHALIKRTADWRPSDWNINPVFSMSAILLKEHPYHFSILLPAIQAVFKHGLHHCVLEHESIVKLLAAYSAISIIPGVQPGNAFADIILEEVKNSLEARQKLHRNSLTSLLQLILWDCQAEYQGWYTSIENALLGELEPGNDRVPYFADNLSMLLKPLVRYLKSSPVTQSFTNSDFKAYIVASRLLVTLCSRSETAMHETLVLQKLDETRHCLRFFNWFLLAILREHADDLCKQLLDFEDVMTDLLVQTLKSVEIDFDTPDISFSYTPSGEALLLCSLILKSWTLLHLRNNNVTASKLGLTAPSTTNFAFWMSIWAVWRRLLDSINPSTLSMQGNTGMPVWEMFLSLVQFLFVSRSEVVLLNAYEWTNLLGSLLDKLRTLSQGIAEPSTEDQSAPLEAFIEQVAKVRKMFFIPPIEIPTTTLIDQLYLDLREIMRYQAESVAFQEPARALSLTMNSIS
ncbi:uncharacterized protein BYT42DRAFT_540161 [Radiomyces spectabilis]|uniref:uncharacterized protein n=1 Tax=Radiomyces spectabilis TaxID=64574 RepID=UPI0022201AF0|nr:uncharacterized protein BYT42DRAFT_540161 [Radiomyces spectabilis]KAI8366708.1 hypothetical protein BYT42DRAFT_540161 [Radiomyces spectabilis]